MAAPAVVISYSHDSQEHKCWGARPCNSSAIEQIEQIEQIDSILDQWELAPGSDMPQFMEQNLARSARVLMICTERYVEEANAGVGGANYEKMIVTADLPKATSNNSPIDVSHATRNVIRIAASPQQRDSQRIRHLGPGRFGSRRLSNLRFRTVPGRVLSRRSGA